MNKENMEQKIEKVIQWANDRNIIKGSTTIKQHDKLLEEVMELRDAIVSKKASLTPEQVFDGEASEFDNEIKDAIGDSLVCLINLSEMMNLSLSECLDQAYNEIKDRKGSMINGIFVKEH